MWLTTLSDRVSRNESVEERLGLCFALPNEPVDELGIAVQIRPSIEVVTLGKSNALDGCVRAPLGEIVLLDPIVDSFDVGDLCVQRDVPRQLVPAVVDTGHRARRSTTRSRR